MADLLEEENNSEQLDLGRYVDIARRRYLHILIPLFCTWLLVWASAWVIPPRYKSATLILVEQPTMPKDYVAPNVNSDLQDRLQSISQQILSRTRLLSIIQKLHLYNTTGQGDSGVDAIEKMQDDITVDLVRDARNNEITAFNVSYQAPDPHVAQQVTTELTNLFIDENLKVRQAQSEGTTKFIEAQLEDARQHLSEQEAKVRAFQSIHEGTLPTQQAGNLQILGGLQSQLESEQNALNAARQQRVYLEALIEQSRPAGPHEGRGTGDLSAGELGAIEQQLHALRAQLVDLGARYTDQYPDIQRLKEQIAKTERLRDQLVAGGAGAGAPVAPPVDDRTAANPGALSQAQGQLKANQLEVQNREQNIAALQAKVAEYQGRLNGEPSTEQQLAELTRGYDQSKATYDDLLRKRNESAMATNMEQMQRGERFTILDPPSLPTKAAFPNRMKIWAIGLGAGLVMGLLVAALFELLDDRIHTDRDLVKMLSPASVFAEIPEMVIPSDERRARTRLAFGWTLGLIFLILIAGGGAYSIMTS